MEIKKTPGKTLGLFIFGIAVWWHLQAAKKSAWDVIPWHRAANLRSPRRNLLPARLLFRCNLCRSVRWNISSKIQPWCSILSSWIWMIISYQGRTSNRRTGSACFSLWEGKSPRLIAWGFSICSQRILMDVIRLVVYHQSCSYLDYLSPDLLYICAKIHGYWCHNLSSIVG